MSQIWECRHCKGELELQSQHRFSASLAVLKPKPHLLKVIWTVCPNRACEAVSLVAKLFAGTNGAGGGDIAEEKPINHWVLLPRSNATTFPEYIPKHLIEDYEEAWAIRA